MITFRITVALIIAFSLGFHAAKWDSKHGAYYGEKAGRWCRIHILKLPPIEEKNGRL